MSGLRTIVVVEDSAECAATIEIALSALRAVEVVLVDTAEAAIETLRAREVHALITDIHLLGMNGLELVAFVRRDTRFVNLPIVVISGDTENWTWEMARSAGATAFFAKPYSPAVVRRTVEEFIDGH
jgi:CheY-like chemotaxis protein